MQNLKHIFETIGGQFLCSEVDFQTKLKSIKAFVFDWDGVFNNASKIAGEGSNFNEADSMGTNMLRFGYYLMHQQLPITAIISGEKNKTAFFFCEREHFTHSYFKISDKTTAFEHLCKEHNLQPHEVAYVFDDVLDLCIAKVCGIRILVNRIANPLFKQHVITHNLADYITGQESGGFAVRETCELLLGLQNKYTDVIEERTVYSDVYKEYIQKRNSITTQFYTLSNQIISAVDSKHLL